MTSRACWPPRSTELPSTGRHRPRRGEIGTTPLPASWTTPKWTGCSPGRSGGAWHLSEAAADLQLDFFLSTSSIASVWGSFGQTAYSAANAFLDGLAWRLREQGSPGSASTSVRGRRAWPTRTPVTTRSAGGQTLSPADALAGMAELMARHRRRLRGGGAGSTGPASCRSTSRREAVIPGGGGAWSARVTAPEPTALCGTPQLVEQLTVARCSSARNSSLEYLRRRVAEVTRIDGAEIREEAGFFDLGMDSLMAVELRRRSSRARQGAAGDPRDGPPTPGRRGGLPARRRPRPQRTGIRRFGGQPGR